VTSRSSSATWPAVNAVAGDPAAIVAARSTRVRSAAGSADSAATSSPSSARTVSSAAAA
jgi:hypothetical protein